MTGPLTAEARGDLAEAMLPVAAHLSAIVHGDGGPEDIHTLLTGLDGQQRDALLVVLAGLVDPDRALGELLGWLDFDEHGRPVVPVWDSRETLRGISDEAEAGLDWSGPDFGVIDQWLRGHPVELAAEDRLDAVLEGLRRGVTYKEMDVLAGVQQGSTYRFLLRKRRAAEQRGEAFPSHLMPAPNAEQLSEAQVVSIRERSAEGATDLELSMSAGVTRQSVAAIVSGERYQQYGGPLRAKRAVARPREASRAVWLGSGEKGSARRGCAA